MRIDQALFGEARAGHALLKHTGADETARTIVPRTDLPDQKPADVILPPYLSGYSVPGHFILSRTTPDTQATRPGMVCTHALILSHADAMALEDLRPLLDLLRAGPGATENLAPLDHLASSSAAPASPLLASAANRLISGPRPVVVAGSQNDFDDLIVALWRYMPPALRRTVYFRMSFSRKDLETSGPPDIVWTPSPQRWGTGEILAPAATETNNPATLRVSGRADDNAFDQFARDLDIAPGSFQQLSHIGQAYALAASDQTSDVANSLRFALQLQPDANRGVMGKRELVKLLVQNIAIARVSGLRPLRNLDLSGLDVSALWRAVEDRVARGSDDDDLADWITVVEDALEVGQAIPAWKEAVRRGVATLAEDAVPAAAGAIVTRFATQAGKLVEVLGWLTPTPGMDRGLAKALLACSEIADPQNVLLILASGGWDLAHAAVAEASLDLEAAVISQLAIKSGSAGLDRLIAKLSPSRLVDLAVDRGDDRLIAAAAAAAAKSSGRLGARNGANRNVQRIWARAMQIDPTGWRAPQDPWATSRAVLGEVIKGLPVAPDLIAELAASPLADLSNWSGRVALWPLLDASLKGKFLHETALGWLRGLEGLDAREAPEFELAAWVMDRKRLEPFLSRWAAESPSVGVRLFDLSPDLDERAATDWIEQVLLGNAVLAPAVAADIGALVNKRHWTLIARALLNAWKKGPRPDLRPAVVACADLFYPVERWLHDLRAPTLDECWAYLEEVASDLYPKGPDEGSIWSRAGGKLGDLPREGSGRDRWRATLRKVRQGGPVKPAKLLTEMRRDFPNSSELRVISDQPSFGP